MVSIIYHFFKQEEAKTPLKKEVQKKRNGTKKKKRNANINTTTRKAEIEVDDSWRVST